MPFRVYIVWRNRLFVFVLNDSVPKVLCGEITEQIKLVIQRFFVILRYYFCSSRFVRALHFRVLDKLLRNDAFVYNSLVVTENLFYSVSIQGGSVYV